MALLCVAAVPVACRARPRTPVRRYALEGTVLAIDRGRGQLVVQHGDIPGFMSAMTMPYPVADVNDFARIETGDRIRADVVVDGAGERLENIVVVGHFAGPPAPGGNRSTPLPP